MSNERFEQARGIVRDLSVALERLDPEEIPILRERGATKQLLEWLSPPELGPINSNVDAFSKATKLLAALDCLTSEQLYNFRKSGTADKLRQWLNNSSAPAITPSFVVTIDGREIQDHGELIAIRFPLNLQTGVRSTIFYPRAAFLEKLDQLDPNRKS